MGREEIGKLLDRSKKLRAKRLVDFAKEVEELVGRAFN